MHHATITPFLMFQGQAEEAMNFYVGLFEDASVTQLERFGPEGPGKEGSVMRGAFRLNGREFRCFDSPVVHPFNFTPSTSLFVDCQGEAQLERLYGELSERGHVLMELGEYGFSRRFGWVNDRFGVSWQINLPFG